MSARAVWRSAASPPWPKAPLAKLLAGTELLRRYRLELPYGFSPR
jgi:hypothetical protein